MRTLTRAVCTVGGVALLTRLPRLSKPTKVEN